MPFTFFMTAGVYFLYVGFTQPGRRSSSYVLAFLMTALSVFMKGPAGVMILLLTALAYAAVTRKWQALRSWSLLWGFALFAAIIAAWIVPTCVIGGRDFAMNLIVRQNVGRFAGDIDHAETFYYYFYKLPLEIAPLNLLIPLCIAFYITVKRRDAKPGSLTFLLVYLIATFLLFELNQSRNIRYLLPMYPGIAILFGMFWDDIIVSQADLRGSAKWILLITGAVVVILALVSIPVMAGWYWPFDQGVGPVYGPVLAIAMAVLLAAAALLWRKGIACVLFIMFVGASLIIQVFSITDLDGIEGAPEQAVFGRLLRDAAGGSELYLYKYYRLDMGETRPAEFFYYGRYTPPIDDRQELDARIAAANDDIHVLALKSVYAKELAEDFKLVPIDGSGGPEGLNSGYEKEYKGETLVLARAVETGDAGEAQQE
jgi:4-amino-4-deoxy-L-arabinose transferase-like glycosyltransferase